MSPTAAISAGTSVRRHRRVPAMLLAACILLPAGNGGWPAPGVATAAPSAAADPDAAPAWTEAALDAVLRPLIINTMTDRYIAGTTVSVVKDGRLVYAAGFGDAEIFQEEPVRAHETIFRIGSVTKVLTGIAVLQLVDDGELDLDADVMRHLDGLQVGREFPEPVRVRHLLTHTAGFDQLGYGRHAASRAEVVPLREFLRDDLVRIRPPGRLAVYDTYGITLAGLLVEQISGLAYADYLQARIFDPLGMARTGIDVPGPLCDDVAIGYGFAGEWEPLPWEFMNTTPASSVNSTATDMARLMLMLLEGGELAGERILSSAAVDAMLSRQHANDPRLPGFGFTFFEDRRHGVSAYSHGGSMEGYACLLYLVPGERLGVFVAYNQESARLADRIVEAVVDRWLDGLVREPEQLPASAGGVDLDRFTGTYASAIRNHTRPGRGGWQAQPVAVSRGESGGLEFRGATARRVGELVFQAESGELWVFQTDAAGRPVRLLVGQSVYEKLPS